MNRTAEPRAHPLTLKIGKGVTPVYHTFAISPQQLSHEAQMNIRHALCIALLILVLATSSSAQTKEEITLPYSPSLDLTSIDKSIDPCVNFYQYSCHAWQTKNPIPPDQTSWSVYAKLYQDNLNFLRAILEQAAANTSENEKDVATREIGTFYASCMDEAAIEKRGTEGLHPQLEAISQLKSTRELAPLIARLQLRLGGSIIFGGFSGQDPDDSEKQIVMFDQGGLGLPDRDYYTKDDPKSKETREKYVQHVQKIFELLGENERVTKSNAETIMRMETDLAQASMTRVDRRDPYKLKNKMDAAGLAQLVPNFDWQAYYAELHFPQFQTVNITAPKFFKKVNVALKSEPLEDWKTYLRFHVANSSASYLTAAFAQEDFDFYRKYLRGATEIQPRWKRCVRYTDRDLPEALGQAYVRKVFSPELKQQTLKMVQYIEAAMEQRINQLDWMSPETKRQALTKLHGIRNKIGYPDRWRDYSSVKLVKYDFLDNVDRAHEFESRRDIAKVGTPVDHSEWDISPPTVDAYYNPQMNDINFPAGVLQPPIYDAKMDAAPNYGDTGGTIGHELTHGFDDEGSQFDAKGNLKDWWTKQDRERFDERTKCVKDQYSQYVVVDDVHINSELTLGEDVADLGGEILAYMAWKFATKGEDLKPIDGLTPEQRFFIGFAQWDCANERPEDLRLRAQTDPHSPARYRINGVVVNMPEFAKAFSCKAGQPMVKPTKDVCSTW
jgi:endothelin-converting enzyme/putative endopeptidase